MNIERGSPFASSRKQVLANQNLKDFGLFFKGISAGTWIGRVDLDQRPRTRFFARGPETPLLDFNLQVTTSQSRHQHQFIHDPSPLKEQTDSKQQSQSPPEIPISPQTQQSTKSQTCQRSSSPTDSPAPVLKRPLDDPIIMR